jgi:hypothetical protein
MILWQDFTSSAPALQDALGRMRAIPFRGLPPLGQPMPGTLLYDAIYGTAHQKLKGVPGRKVLVVISDGLDNGSQKKLEEAVAAAQTTNTIIYGICYQAGFAGCSFLNNLAEPAGGRAFKVDVKTSLSESFRSSKRRCAVNMHWATCPSIGPMTAVFASCKCECTSQACGCALAKDISRRPPLSRHRRRSV